RLCGGNRLRSRFRFGCFGRFVLCLRCSLASGFLRRYGFFSGWLHSRRNRCATDINRRRHFSYFFRCSRRHGSRGLKACAQIITGAANRIEHLRDLRARVQLAGLVDDVLDVLKLGLFQGFVELLLELVGGSAHARGCLAKCPQHLRQILGTDHHDHHDRNNQKFRPTDVEHFLATPRISRARPVFRRKTALVNDKICRACFPTRSTLYPSDQDLVVFLTSLTVSSALASIVRPASLASSSDMPCLKFFMPLATSPISSGILPRPNRRSTTARTISQCQMEKLPILFLSSPHARHIPAIQLRF